MSHPDPEGQFSLLKKTRFAPFFWTQFLGAFNDNVYKNALVLIIAFQAARTLSASSDVLVNLAAGLFILPFFIFSATAGNLADKYEKSQLIRWVKLLEIGIMLLASVAFYFDSIEGLMLLLFLMGTQSTFFGPVKYSIMPQHLKSEELVGGNALVEMGTFVAILLGTIAGGLLVQLENANTWVSIVVVGIAVCGWLVSLKIPDAPSVAQDQTINWNPISETWNILKVAQKERSVFLSIMGISWFWFLGSAYLAQFPNYAKHYLGGQESVVTLLLAMFSIGIGFGSLLCEKLSGRKVELGLVPLGAIGISIFAFDLVFAYEPYAGSELLTLSQYLQQPGALRVLWDLVLIGVFGGFFIVPLYAMVQSRTEEKYRARVIAANNVLNALFMVASALVAILLLGVFDLSIPQFFFAVAVLNVVVSVYIFTVVPEFVMRFLIWVLTHTMYRVKHEGLDNIPDEGPCVVVCNHVSFVDALIIGGACRRPIRFVTYEPIYRMPVLNFIFRTGKAIPIAGRKENPEAFEEAFNKIAQELEGGEVVGIFPEGKLTSDGEINEFKGGIEKILERTPVPVVPLSLGGLWGSFFSHSDGKAMSKLPQRFWSKVELKAGTAIAAVEVTATKLQEKVTRMRGSLR